MKKKNRIGNRFWFSEYSRYDGRNVFMENNNNAKVIGIGPVRIKLNFTLVITFILAHV